MASDEAKALRDTAPRAQSHDPQRAYDSLAAQKALTDAQFEAKFSDCARNAVQPPSDVSIDAALARIAGLGALSDAGELMAAFAG